MHPHQVSKLATYTIALMALTTLHHIYGAIIYDTPWRLHVLVLSIPVIVLTAVLSWLFEKTSGRKQMAVFWIMITITSVAALGLIGLFEGVYNHILKNILFFSGAGADTLQALFPGPKYVMPNDLIFEVTGILQGLMVIPISQQMQKLVGMAWTSRRIIQ